MDSKQTMEEEINEMINNGYIDMDFQPLKCFCGCTEFEQFGQILDEQSIVEFQVKCKDCGQKVGHWAYGNWCL